VRISSCDELIQSNNENEPCVRSLVEFEGSVSRHHQDAFRDGNELNVRWNLAHGCTKVVPQCIPCRDWFATFRCFAVCSVDAVVVHHWHCWTTDALREAGVLWAGFVDYAGIVVEMILVPRLLRTNPHAASRIIVEVVMVVIVVAPEIILKAATSEWEDIVVRFVPTRTIIIVHCLLGIIIVDPEIFGDGTVQRDVGVFPISCHIEWLPVPRVEASVILRLPDHIKDQIPLEQVATAPTIIKVQPCPGNSTIIRAESRWQNHQEIDSYLGPLKQLPRTPAAKVLAGREAKRRQHRTDRQTALGERGKGEAVARVWREHVLGQRRALRLCLEITVATPYNIIYII
jgi:hypothetical protein